MKVFCHASNTTCICYLKKHHNQFREKYVHMSKVDLSNSTFLLCPWINYYKFHKNVSSATNLVSLGIPPGILRLSHLSPIILVLISLTPVPLPGSHRQASRYLECVHPSTAGCPLQSLLPLSEINNLTLISVNKL